MQPPTEETPAIPAVTYAVYSVSVQAQISALVCKSIQIGETSIATSSPVIIHHLQTEQRELLEFILLKYKMKVETELGIEDQPLYTHPTLLTGLSDYVLHSVVENAGQSFTEQDIQALTPVFTVEHAQNIPTILN